MRLLSCVLASALVAASAQPGAAQDTIDRPVTIYVAGTAGGGIDLFARLVARHLGRHIPGNPTRDRAGHAGRRRHPRRQFPGPAGAHATAPP